MTGGARLELADNDLLIDYAPGESPYEQVRQHVIDGLSTATGITSAPGDATLLAVAENSVFGGGAEWNGVAIDDTTIIGKYTYYGDANFDGQVTTDDYVAVDLGLGTGTSWVEGDVDYSGQVTTDDYVVIDLNLGKGMDAPAMASFDEPVVFSDSPLAQDTSLVDVVEQPPVQRDKTRRAKTGPARR
jgi:hypothetical protein